MIHKYLIFTKKNIYDKFHSNHPTKFIYHRIINNIFNDQSKTNDPKLTMKQRIAVNKVSVVPHPVSKLRLFSYAIPEDESDYEKKLRERKILIQNYNHQYWSQINATFNQEKNDYIENELKNIHSQVDFTTPQSHEELAQFYKRFLNENHTKYIEYNFQWYKNNLSLLWPSFVASLIQLKRRLKRQRKK